MMSSYLKTLVCVLSVLLFSTYSLYATDSDSDGISDSDEINIYNTNPDLADTDSDNLNDYQEIFVFFTDPNDSDSDDDGLNDDVEAASTAPGLILHLKLDETSGTAVVDATGTGNDGIITGTSAMTNGKIGGAIDFNQDGYITITSPNFASVTNEITISFWAYGSAAQPLSNSILYARNSSNEPLLNVHLPWDNENVYWDAGNTGCDRINKFCTSSIYKGSWHHWVFVKNSTTGQMKIYLDGTLWHSGSGNIKQMSGITAFAIGASNNGDYKYAGLLDDFKVYNRELSSEAIALLAALTTSHTGTDPLIADTDNDGISDGDEINTYNTDPSDPDSDNDGLLDNEEINIYNTDPNLTDSDGDGFSDSDELNIFNTDPNDANSSPAVLPTGWETSNIGVVEADGQACYYDNKFEVKGSGFDMWGAADEFKYVYQRVHNDCEIVARIVNIEGDNTWNMSGVMIRETLDAGSKHAFTLLSQSGQIGITSRSLTNGTSVATFGNSSIPTPYWVKLVRKDNLFTGYESSNGTTWTKLSEITINMTGELYIGLVVCNVGDGGITTTDFDNVSLKKSLATPVISPDSTIFTSLQDVNITCATPGAEIRYTTDGTEPLLSSTLYTEPVTINQTTTFKAKAFKDLYDNSKTTSAFYANSGYLNGITTEYYSYWSSTTNVSMPDYDNMTAYSVGMMQNFDFPFSYGIFPGSGQSDFLAIRTTGKIFFPEAGDYTFYVNADDAVRLYIDGTEILYVIYGAGETASTTVSITTPGLHDIRLDYREWAYAYKLHLSWEGPEIPKQIIPHYAFFSVDSDNDKLSDNYEIEKYGNLTTSDGTSDIDNDSFSEADEVSIFHTNPQDAQSKPLIATDTSNLNLSQGIAVKYFDLFAAWTVLHDFSNLPYYKVDLLPELNFPTSAENFATSERQELIGAEFKGYIDIPTDGIYEFFLTSTDGSKLYLNDSIVIYNDGLHNMQERSIKLPLEAGKHKICIDFFNCTGTSGLILEWKGPQFQRTIIPSSALFYDTSVYSNVVADVDSDSDGISDIDEATHGTNPNSSDSDSDGISDYDEINNTNTNPLLADSDGDGYSDYDELFIIFSNPNTVDIYNSFTNITTINGSDATVVYGEWQTDGTSIAAFTRNGTISYSMNVPTTAVYRLAVNVTENNQYHADSSFSLTLEVDGDSVASTNVNAPYGTNADALFYLPHLSAGNHTFKITWNNIESDTFLRVNSLTLQAVDGPDNNANGIPDWIDNRLSQISQVTVPVTSKTSPVCVEGENQINIDSLLITGYYTDPLDDPIDPTMKGTIKNRWYSNVTISPIAPSILSFDYQDGSDPIMRTATWTETNALLEDDTTIRINDSLLLAGFPTDAVSGITIIQVNGEQFSINYDNQNSRNSIPYKFEATGEYTVNVTFTPDIGDSLTASMKVNVISSLFSAPPVAIIDESRIWTNTNIDDSSFIEHDSSIRAISDLNPDGRNITLLATAEKTAYITARLSENGPIMDSVPLEVIKIDANPDGSHNIIETFDDGSVMVESVIYLSYVPPNLFIYLKIFVAGHTFEDGTTEKWLTAADFDQYGICKYRIIRAAGATTGVCHHIKIYQDSVLLEQF